MKKRNGFTLVELLAVIVILAVILIIAVPQITKVIKQTRKNAIASTAKLIASKAEEKEVENEALQKDETFDCSDLVKLDNNYNASTCIVEKNAQGKWEVSISGASGGKFEGYTCTGTKDNMTCTDGSSDNSNSNPASTQTVVVFKNGTEVVTTPTIGTDVEIGTEKFEVIKITGNKVTAIPYYNLDLTATSIKQQTSSDTAYDPEQLVAFSSVSSATWNENENINLDVHTNNIKTPIANYESYLNSLGATNVEVKIGRGYPTTGAGATITESEYIGDVGPMNPSGSGTYWIGSSDENSADWIRKVDDGGWITEADQYNSTSYCGIRPVIIITL